MSRMRAGGLGRKRDRMSCRPRELEPARPAQETRLLDPFAVVRQDLGGQTRGELVRHEMNRITELDLIDGKGMSQ